MSHPTATPQRRHTVRVRTYGGKLEVTTMKDLGGDWGYTLPDGRRITSIRCQHTGRAIGFQLDGVLHRTLGDACMASDLMTPC